MVPLYQLLEHCERFISGYPAGWGPETSAIWDQVCKHRAPHRNARPIPERQSPVQQKPSCGKLFSRQHRNCGSLRTGSEKRDWTISDSPEDWSGLFGNCRTVRLLTDVISRKFIPCILLVRGFPEINYFFPTLTKSHARQTQGDLRSTFMNVLYTRRRNKCILVVLWCFSLCPKDHYSQYPVKAKLFPPPWRTCFFRCHYIASFFTPLTSGWNYIKLERDNLASNEATFLYAAPLPRMNHKVE